MILSLYNCLALSLSGLFSNEKEKRQWIIKQAVMVCIIYNISSFVLPVKLSLSCEKNKYTNQVVAVKKIVLLILDSSG